MMGSGKTQVGKRTAKLLSYPFIDLDELIEQELGMTVSAVFAELGETGFRQHEEQIMLKLSNMQQSGVVSLGGGSILSTSGMAALKAVGKVVYLRAKPSTLAQRLSRSKVKRPLIANAPNVEKILAEILGRREGLYVLYADYILDTEDKTTDELAAHLAAWWKEGVLHGF